MSKPRLFWDSSALLDGLFAPDDSPYADLFELGEVGAVDMRISPDVTRECEAILRPYGEGMLGLLAIVLHEANFATMPLPNRETVDYCEQITGYRNDARILAAAEECLADLLVTHDKQHFLGNSLISPPDTHCRVKSAEEALEWCLQQLMTAEEET
ncbi:MAG TPA: type II toxin-antitoxin system VapC family toxin [Chthonomonadaceae bacterium]|nr:type II toxin-antitoxin system VapC family toxin [Chthonomonadaceae bacterium]